MPTVRRGDVSLYYEASVAPEGQRNDGETVAFVGELGLGAWQWGWQHAALAGPYEVLAYDQRGTGRSDAPPGSYSVEGFAADLEAVLADHGARRAHLVGAGLGGMVALAYAREYGRAKTLTLIGTSPGGPRASLSIEPRERLFASPGDRDASSESLSVLFSEAFVADQPEVIERIAEWRAAGDADREGWEAQNAALEDFDASDWLYEMTIPTLVVHGENDAIVPVGNGELLAEGLPRGSLTTYEGAGHGVWIERSRPVNDRLLAFLDGHSG